MPTWCRALSCDVAGKPTSRPTPFLGTPSPKSWQREKAWPPLPLGEPPFCPLPGPFGDIQEGASGALHELAVRVAGQTLGWVPGRAMASLSGETCLSPPHRSCRHALEERGNPALCREPLRGSGRLMRPPLSTPPQPSQQPLAPASPKPAPLRVFDVSGNGPLPLRPGPQHRQQEASLGQCRLCAWCPLLVSLGCCSGPPCPGHQHSVPALPSGCSPPHRPSFYLFLLSPGVWVAGGLHVFRLYPPPTLRAD